MYDAGEGEAGRGPIGAENGLLACRTFGDLLDSFVGARRDGAHELCPKGKWLSIVGSSLGRGWCVALERCSFFAVI